MIMAETIQADGSHLTNYSVRLVSSLQLYSVSGGIICLIHVNEFIIGALAGNMAGRVAAVPV